MAQLIDKGDNKIYCITEKNGQLEEEGDIASGEKTKVQEKNLTDCTHSVCTTKKLHQYTRNENSLKSCCNGILRV